MRISYWSSDVCSSELATLPVALVGGVWFLYLLNYHFSVPAGIGFIALAGVSAEFGVVMLFYLKQAAASRQDSGLSLTPSVLEDAIREGAVMRVRPKAMTVAVILARSEEHTSELQSLMRISYAVFCLKKKKNLTHNNNT